jgi:hypothetical protein
MARVANREPLSLGVSGHAASLQARRGHGNRRSPGGSRPAIRSPSIHSCDVPHMGISQMLHMTGKNMVIFYINQEACHGP